MTATGGTTEQPGSVRSLIPARIDRLPWSPFHTRMVVALGTCWILDGLEITIASNVGEKLTDGSRLGLIDFDRFALGEPELDVATFDAMFASNVRAPFFLVAAFAPGMVARGSGSIVNLGSMAGEIGLSGGAAYGATKASLSSMTRAWKSTASKPRATAAAARTPSA